MKVNKNILRGGNTWLVTFEDENGKIKVVYEYEQNIFGVTKDVEKIAYTSEEEISDIVDKRFYTGIENMNEMQVKKILDTLEFIEI